MVDSKDVANAVNMFQNVVVQINFRKNGQQKQKILSFIIPKHKSNEVHIIINEAREHVEKQEPETIEEYVRLLGNYLDLHMHAFDFETFFFEFDW